jgi:hypothetical protein
MTEAGIQMTDDGRRKTERIEVRSWNKLNLEGGMRNGEKENDEYRITNIECRRKEFYQLYYDKAKRFHPSTFCGSLFYVLALAERRNYKA